MIKRIKENVLDQPPAPGRPGYDKKAWEAWNWYTSLCGRPYVLEHWGARVNDEVRGFGPVSGRGPVPVPAEDAVGRPGLVPKTIPGPPEEPGRHFAPPLQSFQSMSNAPPQPTYGQLDGKWAMQPITQTSSWRGTEEHSTWHDGTSSWSRSKTESWTSRATESGHHHVAW